MEPETPTPSPSSPPASKHAEHLVVTSEESSSQLSIHARMIAGLEPIDTRPDGRVAYQLPNGARLVLSAKRQAKKLVSEHDHLSPRQYKRLRKKLQREAKLPPKEDNA